MTGPRTTRGLVLAAAAAVLATGACTTPPAPDRADATPAPTVASPSTTAARPLGPDDVLPVALAALPPRRGWAGTASRRMTAVSVCGPDLGLPGQADGTVVSTERLPAPDAGSSSADSSRVAAGVVAVPDGDEARAREVVSGLQECDGRRADGRRWTATTASAGGAEVVTVTGAPSASGSKEPRQVFTAAVMDRLVVVCVATDRSASAAARSSSECLEGARLGIAAVRAPEPDRGSVASAAVVAARLAPTKAWEVVSDETAASTPCYGDDPQPPSAGVVATRWSDGSIAGRPGGVLVQPFPDAASATRELENYRELARTCRGEVVLHEATASTPEYRVTRLPAQETESGGGGIRFPSFFGTRTKRQGTSQVTEVFVDGPHLVFVSGEGENDQQAAERVDAVLDDILGG